MCQFVVCQACGCNSGSVACLEGHAGISCQIIDTLPLPICKTGKATLRRKIFKTEPVFAFPPPSKGFCAAKSEAYFGFKGGLRITDYGLIDPRAHPESVLDTTRTAERHSSTAQWEITTVLADSCIYGLGHGKKACLRDTYRIKTPLKSNMKDNPQRYPFHFA